jgi:hypothetical protein
MNVVLPRSGNLLCSHVSLVFICEIVIDHVSSDFIKLYTIINSLLSLFASTTEESY